MMHQWISGREFEYVCIRILADKPKEGFEFGPTYLRSTQFKVHAFCWHFNGLENHCWFKFVISGFDPTLSNCNFVRILEYNDKYYNCNFVRTISSLVHIQVRHKNKWLLTVAPVCSFVHSYFNSATNIMDINMKF